MTLLLSSLLQGKDHTHLINNYFIYLLGNALATVANFFSHLVKLSQPGLQFEDIFQVL